MMRSSYVGLLVAMGVLSSACTVQKVSPGAAANNTEAPPTADPSSPTTTTPAGKSCSELLSCLANCADGDTACEQSCMNSGSASAKAKIDAINTCIEANACTDADCLTSKCSAPVDACKADKPSSSPSPGGGSVPANLVGTWGSSSGNASTVRTFKADGTYTEISGLTSAGACTMKYIWDEEGNATFDATKMTLERTKGTLTTETCSTPKETKPTTAQTTVKNYKLENGILYVYPDDCTDLATCAQKFERQ